MPDIAIWRARQQKLSPSERSRRVATSGKLRLQGLSRQPSVALPCLRVPCGVVDLQRPPQW
jgi:hypothetical protein